MGKAALKMGLEGLYYLGEILRKHEKQRSTGLFCQRPEKWVPKTDGYLRAVIGLFLPVFQCGFFKRKYHQLNLESVKNVQLKSENLLTQD